MRTFLSAALILLLPFRAVADCSAAYLTIEDRKTLKAVAQIEENAGAVQQIIAWAPVTLILTSGNSIEAFFTAANTDPVTMANSISAMATIAACKADQVIQLHILDIDGSKDLEGCRMKFFESLSTMYSESCLK